MRKTNTGHKRARVRIGRRTGPGSVGILYGLAADLFLPISAFAIQAFRDIQPILAGVVQPTTAQTRAGITPRS